MGRKLQIVNKNGRANWFSIFQACRARVRKIVIENVNFNNIFTRASTRPHTMTEISVSSTTVWMNKGNVRPVPCGTNVTKKKQCLHSYPWYSFRIHQRIWTLVCSAISYGARYKAWMHCPARAVRTKHLGHMFSRWVIFWPSGLVRWLQFSRCCHVKDALSN